MRMPCDPAVPVKKTWSNLTLGGEGFVQRFRSRTRYKGNLAAKDLAGPYLDFFMPTEQQLSSKSALAESLFRFDSSNSTGC